MPIFKNLILEIIDYQLLIKMCQFIKMEHAYNEHVP